MASNFKKWIKILSLSLLVLNIKAIAFSESNLVEIEKLVQAGTGCKAKELELGEDYFIQGKWLIIKQEDDYLAQAGPGIALSASRKNCQYNIRFIGEDNYKVALENIYILYQHELPVDDIAVVSVRASLQGSGESASSEREVIGSDSKNYKFLVHKLDLIHSLCDHSRSLNLNTSLRLNPRTVINSGRQLDDVLDNVKTKFISQKSYLFAKINIESCKDDFR